MIRTRYVVRRTRRVRDVLRRKKFIAVRRFPGGREIEIAKAETRRRAVDLARVAARPNGSPTSGGAYEPGYEPGSLGAGGGWRDPGNNDNSVLIQ